MALFLAYTRRVLSPTLMLGDIVVMDNLSSQKPVCVRETIEGAGARLLYIPSCSTDRNPIELAFTKFNWLLQTADQRTIGALRKAPRTIPIQQVPELFPALRPPLNLRWTRPRLA